MNITADEMNLLRIPEESNLLHLQPDRLLQPVVHHGDFNQRLSKCPVKFGDSHQGKQRYRHTPGKAVAGGHFFTGFALFRSGSLPVGIGFVYSTDYRR